MVGLLAQSVEQDTHNVQVIGSIPIESTNLKQKTMKLITYLAALLLAMVIILPLVSTSSKEKEELVETNRFAAEAAAAAANYADSLQIVKRENDSLKTILKNN